MMTEQLPDEMELATAAHVKYIQSLDTKKDEYDYWLTEHLRLNGLYWGLTGLHLMGHEDALPRPETVDFVLSCQHENGGFGAAPGHDAHMLYTVSAVQILVMVDALDELETRGPGKAKVGQFISSLQNPSTGIFAGDEWGEEDTRFLYGALNALSLLGMTSLVNIDKAVEYVVACGNFDGGYGVRPGAESHAGQILTCVTSLAIAGRLDLVDIDKLGRWLSERQLPCGGLNGRPEKREDVCYSWWVLASIEIIGRTHWIDKEKLVHFILECQDTESGGLSDRPNNMVDVWHTCFGIAGLSLLNYPGLAPVDPVYFRYALPVPTMTQMGLDIFAVSETPVKPGPRVEYVFLRCINSPVSSEWKE
ncbi:Geranylgeranyl transferase type-2 subunit beta [Zalerion maritima]|uniref:Geranylgeranyl transferase type-2 subunit beta n=1 Tax=Zalerion maritima TaxID=339359 RepID=A0AAD5WPA3_9PEZI|nr:Geranylgeranyl transferase type-2 subunit beta [Zalerion maritima]